MSDGILSLKMKKFLFIFFVALFLTPGLILNIPPINTFSTASDDDEDSSFLKNMFFTKQSTWLSGFVHTALLMFIIYLIDKLY
jgi:hypothetical protein